MLKDLEGNCFLDIVKKPKGSFVMKKISVGLVLGLFSASVFAQSFQQGPGLINLELQAQGRVIGIQPNQHCYVLVSDQLKRPEWADLGGNGRFFLCDPELTLNIAQSWKGDVIQAGTRYTGIGKRWQIVPVFVPR